MALFVNPACRKRLRALLVENLELDDEDVYVVEGPLGLSNLMELTASTARI